MMKEGDTVLETKVGRYRPTGEWFWYARGPGLGEHLAKHAPNLLPVAPDGSICVGPFKNERAALRDLEEFERNFFEREEIEVKDAPDPRTLH